MTFQPKVIGGLVGIGIFLQSAWLFLGLSAVLWWSTIVARHNIFDAIYNLVVANPRRLAPIPVSPATRRFAMGEAATVALVIGAALLTGARTTAWIFEGLFVIAVMAVIFARFCTGAYTYHVLRRHLFPIGLIGQRRSLT